MPTNPLNPQSPNPSTLIPRPSSPPRGFTLIEMLIAITIMVMLMALAATTILPATESRRSREAARALNVYLGSARNRAMETGRPCGVIFHRFGTLACSMSIDQCEVPPCYCGETEQSAAVTLPGGGVHGNVRDSRLTSTDADCLPGSLDRAT